MVLVFVGEHHLQLRKEDGLRNEICMDNEIVQANTEMAGQALVNYDPLGHFVYFRERSWYSSFLFLDG